MPTFYGYGRASKVDQVDTLPLQKEGIDRLYSYKFEGTHARGQVFTDSGQSGGRPLRQRPEGARLNLALEAGDVVAFTKLDRGFRNVRDCLEVTEAWLARGVRMVFMDLDVDTSTPSGKLMLTILAAMAEFERARIAERCHNIAAWRKARGLPCGGPHEPYGWKRVGAAGKRRLEPDPYTRDIGRKIVEWFDQGWTLEAIYFHLLRMRIKTRRGKEWTTATIDRAAYAERVLQAIEASGRTPTPLDLAATRLEPRERP